MRTPFIQVEEVTLPLRFLLKTAHFIAVLTIVFDIDMVVMNMTQVDPRTAVGDEKDEFNSVRQTMRGLSYAALACFGIEFITMIMGVTIFMRFINGLNIIAHLVGLILTILFYTDNWNLDSFIAFFTVFNALPAFTELVVLLFLSKFSFLKY